MTLRLNGTTSGYSEIDAPAVATNQSYILSGIGGVIDRLQRPGNVLQVVNATQSTQVASSSTTFADTGLTATITPTFVSSKILVLVSHATGFKTGANTGLNLRLFRGSTFLLQFERNGGFTNTTADNAFGASAASFLDSPATTSATTYKTQFANNGGVGVVIVQATESGGQPTSTITLMEIAA